ncbi:glutathione S-transferase T3-like protein [Tanacetum coccineum]
MDNRDRVVQSLVRCVGKERERKRYEESGVLGAAIAYFDKETGETQGYDATTSKWKNRVRPRIGAFCAIIDNVERKNESGSSDLTVNQKALAEYEAQYEHPFTSEPCWNILKDHAVWKEVEMPNFYKKIKGRSKKSKTSETTSGSAQGGFNLNDEADGFEEEIREERPIGRDRAKKKASSSSRSATSSIA